MGLNLCARTAELELLLLLYYERLRPAVSVGRRDFAACGFSTVWRGFALLDSRAFFDRLMRYNSTASTKVISFSPLGTLAISAVAPNDWYQRTTVFVYVDTKWDSRRSCGCDCRSTCRRENAVYKVAFRLILPRLGLLRSDLNPVYDVCT